MKISKQIGIFSLGPEKAPSMNRVKIQVFIGQRAGMEDSHTKSGPLVYKSFNIVLLVILPCFENINGRNIKKDMKFMVEFV